MSRRKYQIHRPVLLMIDTEPEVAKAMEQLAKSKGITMGELLARLLGMSEE